MIGAIIGDIVGSRFEFSSFKSKDFELFTSDCDFTDDTILTVATADAILNGRSYKDAYLDWGLKRRAQGEDRQGLRSLPQRGRDPSHKPLQRDLPNHSTASDPELYRLDKFRGRNP